MYRLAACLIVCLALAVPAAAREGRITVVQPTRDAALRGSISATPVAPPDDAPLLLPLPVQPTSIASSPTSGSQCRLSCSQQYYFCLAGEDENCSRYWSRCVSRCGS